MGFLLKLCLNLEFSATYIPLRSQSLDRFLNVYLLVYPEIQQGNLLLKIKAKQPIFPP